MPSPQGRIKIRVDEGKLRHVQTQVQQKKTKKTTHFENLHTLDVDETCQSTPGHFRAQEDDSGGFGRGNYTYKLKKCW